ncbi:phospholipid phosphatase-related protein type 2 isoform X2 [Protopterus annectens]|uniref:phospholipid phosphatase-related protein type 2 isoform X2 n=1 Tax=Protopterus annectens TaxID=7888 RepID=UPI001CFBC06F|nr:phospholipid phosphatase-related protein type 2 isoform X2 [Protopterus annectens]
MAGGEQEVKKSFSIIPCFVFIELVIMAGTVLLAYHFEYTNTFPVHMQGFFCYDSTFSKPYPGPEDLSKAPPALVYSLVTAIPTVMILIGELSSFFFHSGSNQEKTIITGECCYFNPLLRRIVRFLGVYSFGLFATTIFANAGQVVTGNLTPHFLTVCRPNYTALGCQSPLHYITETKACTGVPALINAARKAFPSKDAALSAYAAVYTVMYVTLVYRIKGSRLAKPSICLSLLCPAFLVGVVHVAEYRNHWSDVLAGFLTGGTIAAFLVVCVVSSFQTMNPPQKKVLVQEKKLNPPVMPLPCLESPLEKIIELRSQISPDPRLCMFPVTPDVLIPSRSVTSEV